MFAGAAADAIGAAIDLRQPNRWRSSALDRLGIIEARLIQAEDDEAGRLGILALDDVRNTGSDRAYEAANEVLVGEADRMIAVWDGQDGQRAGTGTVVALAHERGIPVDVVWPKGAERC
ncbi:hypothetical protein ACFWU5_28695 [Nocardia sp. NPDC058640]|uniref:hypothetical protein n=1 Tax=Nocardia sp. NPDC058640 TaxID=3346571 RepID=UPI003663EE79